MLIREFGGLVEKKETLKYFIKAQLAFLEILLYQES